jgi:hypothetical protein
VAAGPAAAQRGANDGKTHQTGPKSCRTKPAKGTSRSSPARASSTRASSTRRTTGTGTGSATSRRTARSNRADAVDQVNGAFDFLRKNGGHRQHQSRRNNRELFHVGNSETRVGLTAASTIAAL